MLRRLRILKVKSGIESLRLALLFVQLCKSISVLFSLTLKNPNRATGGGALESTINAIIANREHLSDYLEVRDKLLTFEN